MHYDRTQKHLYRISGISPLTHFRPPKINCAKRLEVLIHIITVVFDMGGPQAMHGANTDHATMT
jgi:hypothetical protein